MSLDTVVSSHSSKTCFFKLIGDSKLSVRVNIVPVQGKGRKYQGLCLMSTRIGSSILNDGWWFCEFTPWILSSLPHWQLCISLSLTSLLASAWPKEESRPRPGGYDRGIVFTIRWGGPRKKNSKINSGVLGLNHTWDGSSMWNLAQLYVCPALGQSNWAGDRWLKWDHTQRRREEEEWRSVKGKREWVKGQVHSVSLVWLIWRGETTISACVSGSWRQHSSSKLTMACFPF